jgi:hypothetical protein
MKNLVRSALNLDPGNLHFLRLGSVPGQDRGRMIPERNSGGIVRPATPPSQAGSGFWSENRTRRTEWRSRRRLQDYAAPLRSEFTEMFQALSSHSGISIDFCSPRTICVAERRRRNVLARVAIASPAFRIPYRGLKRAAWDVPSSGFRAYGESLAPPCSRYYSPPLKSGD